ncbi:MAG TPA: hypothetical protein VFH42_05055 [Sporolactobacillaceae bacterium]|nr:hypothetical protein [Sporolactobacillaceae bacterium]
MTCLGEPASLPVQGLRSLITACFNPFVADPGASIAIRGSFLPLYCRSKGLDRYS